MEYIKKINDNHAVMITLNRWWRRFHLGFNVILMDKRESFDGRILHVEIKLLFWHIYIEYYDPSLAEVYDDE